VADEVARHSAHRAGGSARNVKAIAGGQLTQRSGLRDSVVLLSVPLVVDGDHSVARGYSLFGRSRFGAVRSTNLVSHMGIEPDP